MEKCLHFSMTFLLILHAANAATEMERQRNRGELLIAAVLNLPCGECRDRDEAERNRGALLIAAVLTCLHKFLYLPRDDLHQPLPGFDRCPGDVRCDEKPVLIFYI